jgi:predicted ATP-dependent protease
VAVTGSVNQLGAVQPIGGVNEKIEGFFDKRELPRFAAGLKTACIPVRPRAWQIRSDIVEAATAGRFSTWAAWSVDEAIEHLTGVPAGMELPDGGWLDGSVNGWSRADWPSSPNNARSFRTEA